MSATFPVSQRDTAYQTGTSSRPSSGVPSGKWPCRFRVWSRFVPGVAPRVGMRVSVGAVGIWRMASMGGFSMTAFSGLPHRGNEQQFI